MADIQFSHGMGAYGRESEDAQDEALPSGALTMITNVAGAVVSLALIAGIGVWGYELMARDVSGIPIVQAAEGEMRVRPEVPGGQLARHQGLAVNAVAAEGQASGPVDQVTLAPKDTDLSHEDQPISAAKVAPVTQPKPLAPASDVITRATPGVVENLQDGAIDAVVAELTAGTKPLAEAQADSNATTDIAATDTVPTTEKATPALAQRIVLRPKLRPDNIATLQKASLTVETPASEVDASAIPAGTRLAQLGAFDSADVARAEWARLETRFGDYLQDKSRVVQQAQSGGRTFYRLRAMGFVDIADARRFCSAFKAEGVDCIPVAVK
ncbi:MAG: SPOR domain-containing protein [Paracoccaceae bacterium]|nr:SPOR domain-containing protein [Paracoccaceae bacterium]